MNATYSPREFGKLIGRAVITLQRWDRAGILSAHRTPTGRRYYTHDQYLAYCGRPVVPPQERQVVTQDMLSIEHCFSSRLYGLRKYKKQIQTLAAEQEPI